MGFRPLKVLGTVAVSVLAVACLAAGAVTLLPAALGMQHYVIESGSMTGTYDRGSVVFTKKVPVESLRRGDVITYQPPVDADASGLLTHRIFSISHYNGETVFRTKGDANRSPDRWSFTLDEPTQARVQFDVPYLGYLLAGLQIRWVRMLAIGLPAALIAISVLAGLVRDARREEDEEIARLEWTSSAA
jgi:signal peptidase I